MLLITMPAFRVFWRKLPILLAMITTGSWQSTCAAWSCMKFELQKMREQGSGAIVNCSSLGGLVGGNQRGTYHAAKHGVIGFTKSAALEYATRGIRVNDVCPGMIRTPMFDKMIAEGQGEELNAMLKTLVPMGRMGRPEEIADAVLWLCSSAATYVTGQSISVDGGYVMR